MMGEQALPTQLGKARIDWNFGTPHKQEDEIRTSKNFLKMTLVANGLGCVVEYEGNRRGSYTPSVRNVFFGTDPAEGGQPFLTGVSKPAINALHLGGEEAFFKALIPRAVAKLASVLKQEVLRQGDFYAVRIGSSWTEAMKNLQALELVGINIRETGKWSRENEQELFRSRHSFTGEMQSMVWLANGKTRRCPSMQHFLLVSGIISAPDHAELDLSDGVFAIAKSTMTYSAEIRGAD